MQIKFCKFSITQTCA